ncbi:MAG: PEP-CTERM sorting domain-containing protein [Pirellulaceae bacterium]
MKTINHSTHSKSKCVSIRLSEKLAIVAGTGAALAAFTASPSIAGADVVQSLTAPISPPISDGTTFWDVDGDGTNDFALVNYFTSTAYFDDVNGGRLVVPAAAFNDGIAKLAIGLTVGTGLTAAYKFHAAAQNFNTITVSGVTGSDASNGGWVYGDTGFFGFKFTNASGTHFGWGEMTIADRGNAGNGDNYIINRAYYNDTANAAIQVGSTGVPEPSSAALLAMGAAGLATWRRRRNRAAV